MTLSPRLEARQSQTLAMTPQLQQAIKLLQMSNLQLAEFVAEEVAKNPLLELVNTPPRAAHVSRTTGGAAGDAAWIDAIAAEATLRDHLLEQIGAARAEAPTARTAALLAEELDEDGYLRGDLTDLAAHHHLDPADVEHGLELLQSCDPAGVGARDLAECLALQLREHDRLDPAMRTLVDHLALVAAGRTDELRALCDVDTADFTNMLAELRALDPKPGQRFARAPVQYALPDVYVQRLPSGEWTVELNTDTLPRVLVNNIYAAEIGTDAAARQFVSEFTTQANWLVRSLAQRARTILRVATDVVAHQQGFFSVGVSEMRPLTRREVADRLDLHESTISRVAVGKHLACERGLFPLRFFFSAAIRATEGGDAFAAAAVQDRIRHLILLENGTRILSDESLASILRHEGIDVARRTIAKYREGMGIPSSVARRRLKSAVREGTVVRAYGERRS